MIHIVVTIRGGAAEVFYDDIMKPGESIKVSLIDYDVKEECGDENFKIDTFGYDVMGLSCFHADNEIESIPESVREDIEKFS